MKQVISLETAKLFMEYEQLIDVTDIDSDYELDYESYYCPEDYGEKLIDHCYGTASRIERHGWRTYPAFFQEDLKNYLRKNYGILVETVYSSGFDKPCFTFRIHVLKSDTRQMIEQMEDYDQTYEEALEAGLRVGIKYLKK